MKRQPDWTKATDLSAHELACALEEDHDEVDDNPEATDAELADLRSRHRRPGQRGPGKKPAKVLLTMRVDAATLEAWQATGEGWRGRMADLLTREVRVRRRTS